MSINIFSKKDYSDVAIGKVRIRRYSHFFIVDAVTPKFLHFIYLFAKDYTEFHPKWDWKKKKRQFVPKKTYVLRLNDGEEFRFHRGQWGDFMDRLSRSNIHPDEYQIVDYDPSEGDKIDFKIKDGWLPREDQPEVIEHVLNENAPLPHTRTVTMRTGGGKTFTAFWCAQKLGVRFAIIVLAMYLEKWFDDIQKYTDIDKSEVCVIKGSDVLQRATLYPDSNKPIPKVFIISITTMQSWYKLHEENICHPLLDQYSCAPDEFFPHLGIGFAIFDEVHQHPYAVFRIQTYMKIKKSLQLTATLLTKNESLKRIQKAMFPISSRFSGDDIEPYMKVRTCMIKVPEWDRCPLKNRYMRNNNYNHTEFEKTIMKHPVLFENYKDMVVDYIQSTYFRTYVPGDKMVLFVAKVEMAKAFRDRMLEVWPDFDIRSFTEGDPYENLIVPDIRVSTILSAGTAHDIPDLRHAYMLVALDSPNAVAQSMGRLRDLKKTRSENNDVFFHFFVFTDIDKHMLYFNNRKQLVNRRSKDQNVLDIGMLEWKRPERYMESRERRERLMVNRNRISHLKVS